MNIFMLLIWLSQLAFGIISLINGTPIHPFVFICAVIVCIVHYLTEIFSEN